jgi:hypothetical protein
VLAGRTTGAVARAVNVRRYALTTKLPPAWHGLLRTACAGLGLDRMRRSPLQPDPVMVRHFRMNSCVPLLLYERERDVVGIS